MQNENNVERININNNELGIEGQNWSSAAYNYSTVAVNESGNKLALLSCLKCTYVEQNALFLKLGLKRALKLDSGGSTAFFYKRNPSSTLQALIPSERPQVNAIRVLYNSAGISQTIATYPGEAATRVQVAIREEQTQPITGTEQESDDLEAAKDQKTESTNTGNDKPVDSAKKSVPLDNSLNSTQYNETCSHHEATQILQTKFNLASLQDVKNCIINKENRPIDQGGCNKNHANEGDRPGFCLCQGWIIMKLNQDRDQCP